MFMSTYVSASARFVRSTCLALATALLVGFVSVQAFMAQYGTPASVVVLDASGTDRVLGAAIASQERAGLRCSEKPTLTDVVLFQPARGEKVSVVSFADAIARSAAHEGWIRRYCV
ncbi:MAG: hypothetical protein JWR27_370 [Aeromicrobium sp.]|jgi:hypothetical protein|nr:hypothetical protein [Aeromicrobium sp.]